jgi:iron complex transport system permease protein
MAYVQHPYIDREASVLRAVARKTRSRRRALAVSLFVMILALAAASLMVGPAALTYDEIIQGLRGEDAALRAIVVDIRLPRTLLAAAVGAVLGICGAAAQALTRNALADPAVFGAPQAAALGAVCVLYFGFANALSLTLPIVAICGALASMLVIVALAAKRAHVTTLLLAGIAVGSLCGAAISLALSLSPNPYATSEIVFWLLGSFSDRTFQHILLSAPFMIASVAILLRCGPAYRALTLGEDTASVLGVHVGLVSVATALAIALGVGAATAVSGAIGFIGLMAPHFVRRRCGGDPQAVLVPAGLVGSLLLLGSDICVRLVPATTELRVGALTALLGAPFFLYVVFSGRAALGNVR